MKYLFSVILAMLSLMVQAQFLAPTPEVGRPYIDLSMNGLDGKKVKLSDYVKKNKYTFIDFWASWCGPCRKEMPNVVRAYDTYHKKGLGIVGVSLDTDKSMWAAAVKQLKMPWPHMSDLKGWESEAVELYQFNGIPYNVLVNSKGIIVATNLRGDDLLFKLSTLLR